MSLKCLHLPVLFSIPPGFFLEDGTQNVLHKISILPEVFPVVIF